MPASLYAADYSAELRRQQKNKVLENLGLTGSKGSGAQPQQGHIGGGCCKGQNPPLTQKIFS